MAIFIKMENHKIVRAIVSEDLKNRFANVAQKKGVSKSSVIRTAIHKFIKENQ